MFGTAEIERAQQTARGRDAEREQFHRKYVFDLAGDTVTQIEVITEFRRLVIDHGRPPARRRPDVLARRSRRGGSPGPDPRRDHFQGAAALPPAQYLRHRPRIPDGARSPVTSTASPTSTNGALVPFDTQVTGQYSLPFKTRDGKTVKHAHRRRPPGRRPCFARRPEPPVDRRASSTARNWHERPSISPDWTRTAGAVHLGVRPSI